MSGKLRKWTFVWLVLIFLAISIFTVARRSWRSPYTFLFKNTTVVWSQYLLHNEFKTCNCGVVKRAHCWWFDKSTCLCVCRSIWIILSFCVSHISGLFPRYYRIMALTIILNDAVFCDKTATINVRSQRFQCLVLPKQAGQKTFYVLIACIIFFIVFTCIILYAQKLLLLHEVMGSHKRDHN